MREHTHDLGKAVDLADVEKLELFLQKEIIYFIKNTVCHHLKAKGGVDEEQDEVCALCAVDHRVEVVSALEERESALLPADDGDGSLDLAQVLRRVPFDERADERALADLWRAHNGDQHRRRLHLRAVGQRHVQTLLLLVGVAGDGTQGAAARVECKGLVKGGSAKGGGGGIALPWHCAPCRACWLNGPCRHGSPAGQPPCRPASWPWQQHGDRA